MEEVSMIMATEKDLRERAAWMEMAAEAAGVGTYSWDILKNRAACSLQYYRIINREPGKWMSLEEWIEIVHGEDADMLQGAVDSTVEYDSPFDLEYRILWPDGTVRWVRDLARVVKDDKGKVVGFNGALLDITLQKEDEAAQQELRDEVENKVEARMMRGGSYGLTFRELTVLNLVSDGQSDKDIAHELGISPHTASRHVKNILVKMGANSRTDAGVRAVKEELL